MGLAVWKQWGQTLERDPLPPGMASRGQEGPLWSSLSCGQRGERGFQGARRWLHSTNAHTYGSLPAMLWGLCLTRTLR